MAKFFINRPIVAMVISIIMTILGVVAMVQLPIAEFPNIAPPEIMLQATYVGADAVTLEKSVATPIEQMMSGVDNMLYMYSVNANNGQMTLRVNFDINTRPNDDQILAQMRYAQAESQLPSEVKNFGVAIKKSTTSPLALFSLYSPNGTYDATFLANYAYVNINDPMTRVPGLGQVQIFGAGQYAMRFWVRPDQLAKLGITVTEILNGIKAQNTVNPAGQIGAEPVPAGQEFTYSVRAQGRLETEEEFGSIVIRANKDGSMVRLKDVARIELGSQMYNMIGRMNGKPSAIVAIYQLPGSNAIQTMDAATKLMEEMKERFPADLDYVTSLDTTQAVREGIKEIVHTLFEALVLVIIVVYLFLQGWRATLIPFLAVPVSLIGAFALFPLLGFLDQHAVALRPGARDRLGCGRRDCGGRGGGAPHRSRHVAQRGEPQGHGRSVGAGDRHCADSRGRVCSDGLHTRHHRSVVPAVRRHHRLIHRDLGFQRADPQSRAGGPVVTTQTTGQGAAGRILQLVQPMVWACDGRLCDGLRPFDS